MPRPPAALVSPIEERRALTAEKFVPDPFGGYGGRMYRTGDVVRVGDGGILEFAGRSDHQVQIRGFRVELGEIEETLRRHDEVESAVTVVRTGEAGVGRLVAYVVARRLGDEAELRAFCKERLPAFMVPSLFGSLDSLPLNVNEKVDRAAVPEPDLSGGRETAVLDTDTERFLARVWTQLLGIDVVGAGDDFFELGGHSLLAPQLVSTVRASHTVRFDVRDVFEASTLTALAALLDRRKNGQ